MQRVTTKHTYVLNSAGPTTPTFRAVWLRDTPSRYVADYAERTRSLEKEPRQLGAQATDQRVWGYTSREKDVSPSRGRGQVASWCLGELQPVYWLPTGHASEQSHSRASRQNPGAIM